MYPTQQSPPVNTWCSRAAPALKPCTFSPHTPVTFLVTPLLKCDQHATHADENPDSARLAPRKALGSVSSESLVPVQSLDMEFDWPQ